MKKYLITFLLLAGCTGVPQYQAECNSLHPKFKDALACINQKIDADWRSRAPANAGEVSNLKLYGAMLSEQVAQRKITDTEAKYLFDQRREELKASQMGRFAQTQQLINQQQMINSLNRPQTTNCFGTGMSVNCTTY